MLITRAETSNHAVRCFTARISQDLIIFGASMNKQELTRLSKKSLLEGSPWSRPANVWAACPFTISAARGSTYTANCGAVLPKRYMQREKVLSICCALLERSWKIRAASL